MEQEIIDTIPYIDVVMVSCEPVHVSVKVKAIATCMTADQLVGCLGMRSDNARL